MSCAPVANYLVKKLGTHPPMYLGCILWGLGFMFASLSSSYYQLFLSQGVLVGLGAGLVWLPAAPVLPAWFSKKRSLAQGIASSGSGSIGVVYAVATTPMIENVGLPWALRITGLTSFVMLVVSTFLMRDRNKKIRPDIRPFDTRMLRNPKVSRALILYGEED
jgi:MFS family permease